MAWFRKPAPVEPVEQISAHERITRAEVAYIKATEGFVAGGKVGDFEHATHEWFKEQPLFPPTKGFVHLVFVTVEAMLRRYDVDRKTD